MRFLGRFCLIASTLAVIHAQSNDGDRFGQFQRWLRTQPELSIYQKDRNAKLPSTLTARYREKLIGEGVSAEDADRWIDLLQNHRDVLMRDLWNNVYLAPQPTFNTAPLQFLATATKGRTPGKALDVGMGQGRNAVWLATQGWDVTGIDISDRGVAIGIENARKQGARLNGIVTREEDFPYGETQWDLILYSYGSPTVPASTISRALRPGGIIVVEDGPNWDPRQLFSGLTVLKYEEVDGPAFNGRIARVFHYSGQKPGGARMREQ